MPLLHNPGEAWSYSVSTDVLGRLVEVVSGQSLIEFFRSRIFAPLGMTDTDFWIPAEKRDRLASLYRYDEQAERLARVELDMYQAPPDYTPGGGGLISSASDYHRFARMLLNGGELNGVRILSPGSVELMGTNVVPDEVLVSSNGTTAAAFTEDVGFGLDFRVVNDAAAAGLLTGDGEMSWGGAAGTWFWVDPEHDIIFVGMIQRMGGTGGDDLGTMARTLTYQALVEPEM